MFGRFGPGHPGMEKAKGAKDTRATLKRLWGYLGRQRGPLTAASLVVVATSGLTLLGPYLLGRAIDGYIITRDLPGLARICALMLGVYLLSSLLTWVQSFIMAGVAQRTVRDLRNDLFEALQRLPVRYFDTHQHGDVMSRLTNDVESVSQVLSDSVTNLVSGLLTLVGSAVLMFALNVPLAAASVLTVGGLTLLLNRFSAGQTRQAFREQQKAIGALNGLIEETVSGQRVVKAYQQEGRVLREFAAANQELRRAATRAQILAGMIGPLMNGVNNLGLAMVAGLGGFLAVRGLATVGNIATFISYSRQFGRPLTDIANLYNSIQSALAGAERVFEVIDETPETDAPEAKPLDAVCGEVIFEDVDFSYVPGTPVLREVSLHAKPGETVALIGPTGAGKTTIINLLTRFYEIESGRILLDGQDIRDLRKEDLRRQLGIVLQDTYLFAGTVMENLRYGRLDATEAEVIAAAKLANAHAFIHRLPHGYDTPLTERGGNLSQGQRQLLAIARAILAEPRVLILDEATSSVDTRTEKHIQEAMKRLMAGRTSFVIAHRLSTIREADQILVIDKGEIIERGTHEELMAERGFYYRLSSGRFHEVEEDDEVVVG
jgi:ATP-binding cassette subfamily B protein